MRLTTERQLFSVYFQYVGLPTMPPLYRKKNRAAGGVGSTIRGSPEQVVQGNWGDSSDTSSNRDTSDNSDTSSNRSTGDNIGTT